MKNQFASPPLPKKLKMNCEAIIPVLMNFFKLHDIWQNFNKKINLQNWEYRNEPAPDSAEEEIVKVLKQPRDWV